MSSYDYYRGAQAGWGTPGYEGITPPPPTYQPQPNWTGQDYYSAHSGLRDSTIFDYVFYKIRDLVTGTGVGLNHAQHWWRRVYGGLVDLAVILPRELGAAAGYEALRLWETHSGIYAAPLAEDREREREAIIGIAVAEATKLWGYTRRPLDKYGRLEASEIAAATASRIFLQTYDYDSPYDSYNANPRLRPLRSVSGTRYDVPPCLAMNNDIYDDYDNYTSGPDIVNSIYPTRLRPGRTVNDGNGGMASPFPDYANGNNLAAPSPVRPWASPPSPATTASLPGSPRPFAVADPAINGAGFAGRRLRTPIPGGRYRSLSPGFPYGAGSPMPLGFDDDIGTGWGAGMYGGAVAPNLRYGAGGPGFGNATVQGLGGMGAGVPGLGYGAGVPGLGSGLGAGAGFGAPGLGVGMCGTATGSDLAAMGANNTNVTYDPLLGPGIRGTYFPEAASRTAALESSGGLGGYGMPYGNALTPGMGAMGLAPGISPGIAAGRHPLAGLGGISPGVSGIGPGMAGGYGALGGYNGYGYDDIGIGRRYLPGTLGRHALPRRARSLSGLYRYGF